MPRPGPLPFEDPDHYLRYDPRSASSGGASASIMGVCHDFLGVYLVDQLNITYDFMHALFYDLLDKLSWRQ